MSRVIVRSRPVVLPLLTALLPVLTAGCVSTSGEEGSGPGTSTRIYGMMDRELGSGELELSNSAAVLESDVEFPPDRVWGALVEVVGELGIPLTGADPGTRVLETRNVRVRRIGNRSMSRWVDCGSTATGARADRYDVHLTLVAQVVDRGEAGSRIRHVVDAWARPSTRSGSPVHCTSTGRLVPRIVEELEARLGGGVAVPTRPGR